MDTHSSIGLAPGQDPASWFGVFLVVAALLGFYGWYKFFREEPQEPTG